MKTMDNKSQQSQACPDASVMVAYCAGTLSPSEQHALERHVLECPLCEDALEGIQQLEQPAKLLQIQTELQQAAVQPSTRKKVIPLFQSTGFRIAAVFLIVVLSAGALLLFRPDNNPNNLALEKIEKEPTTPAVMQEEVSSFSKEETVSEKEVAIPSDLSENVKSPDSETRVPVPVVQELHEEEVTSRKDVNDELSSPPIASVTEADKTDQGNALSTVDSDSRKLKKEAATTESSEDASYSETKTAAEVMTTKAVVANKGKAAAATTAPIDYYQQGLQYFGDQKYPEALSSFKRSAENPEAMYWEGRCYFELKRFKDANKAFSSYLSSRNPSSQESAWWFKALSQKQLNDNDGAKKSLDKVISFHGEYEQRAKTMLRTLP